ncbi:MAG TPA: YdcH family protein, partial [Polyangiaceae bacterium]
REREFRTPITGKRGRTVAGERGQKEIRTMKESVLEEYLSNLESRHRDLDDAVSRLDRRAYLTPTEQRTVAELKKEKLLTKDRIVKLRSTPPPSR